MKATTVKAFIESIYCTTHKEHPQVSIDSEGHVCVECCCMQFQKQCNYLVNILFRPGHKTYQSDTLTLA
ncbi:MAG TPA: hypothetical protein VIM89_06190 [Mucilaginibacter sp.]